MKASTREKTIRNLIASILSSDLSDQELAELAESFIMRDTLVLEIGHILRDLNMRLSTMSRGRRLEPELSHVVRSPLTPSEVTEIVKSAGIAQVELLHIIGSVLPDTADLLSRKRLSTTAIIDRLFAETSAKDRQAIFKTILRYVQARIPVSDPYLDLITDKLNQVDVSD